MTDDMDEPIIEKVSKKEDKKKQMITISKDNLFRIWFITKGWIYLMAFVMGILVGGLIWK